MIGKLLIGRYLVLEQLDAGSFSKTFLTLDKYLPQSPLCVVKASEIEEGQDAEQVRSLFGREALVLQQLERKSDQFPRLLAYVEEEAQVYLVEDFIDGIAIDQQLIEKQTFSTREVIAFLYEVLEIFQVIHAQGLIYQDLKLNHLIRRADGKLALVDFGTAIRAEDPDRENLAFGTPGYSPIEQQTGQPTFSSDLYALGVCAIQLLTGIPPDHLQSDSGAILWHSHLDSIDADFAAIIDRFVAREVRDRYQSTTEALAALRHIKTGIAWRNLRGSARRFSPSKLASFQKVLRPSWGVAALLVLGIGFLGRQWLIESRSTGEAIAAQLTALKQGNLLIPVLERSLPTPIQQLAMTANQTVLVGARSLDLWDTHSGKIVQSFQSSNPVTSFVMEDGGKWLVGRDNEQVWIWSAATGQLAQTLTIRPSISKMILSSDGKILITATANQIQRWNLSTGKRVQTIDTAEAKTPLLQTNANDLICETSQHRLQVIDVQTGEIKRVLAGHTGSIQQILFSPDQRLLYSFGSDRTLVWNYTTGELVKAFPVQSAQAIDAAIRGDRLVTLHSNGTLRIWDRASGKLQQTTQSLDGQTALSSDGQYVVNHGRDQQLRVMQIALD
ncbi:serine/threonine-protein kinase [Leptolyngbya sp. NIES-2104]|uniref:serine/threonine-protein kinase n=1 Tax=Leptolyngbya sp. NIES-2104 TaxID=1552121 RepID=UPI0006EC630F|nr:serine/threonine-protein kinase [Leptolyngbya sp. NIES-2104]GAP99590.1 serine/threonine kinase [Leptolyngbya sp. NIES-2104]